MSKTIVLALGGNAIIKANEKGTWDEQITNIKKNCSNIAALLKQGHRVIVTHGNGPQVGNILIQNEMSGNILPVMPLDVIVAKTQGSIGYAIAQFPAGSMGPKIEAAIRFAQSDSCREAFIVSFDNAHKAFDGISGTKIHI